MATLPSDRRPVTALLPPSDRTSVGLPVRDGTTRPPTPAWTHTFAVRCYLLAVFLIPVQITSDALKSVIETRFSPGDFVLALSVLLAPASVRIVRQPLVLLPIGLPLVLAYGVIASLVVHGELSDHALKVKFLGSAVLVVLGLVTLALAREGFGPYILRTYLLGATVCAVVGYIDWKIADVLPPVSHGNPSRFAGLVADPNNAGALFASTMLISIRYGRRLFVRRSSWIIVSLVLAFSLSQTLSRGAFIGTAVAVAAMLAVERVAAERWLKLILAGCIALGVVVASGFVDTAVDDFSRRPDNVGDRGELVSGSVDLWTESRGIGAGLGTIRLEGGEIVHNTGVWLVAEMSLPGLLYLAAVLAIPTLACLRLRRRDPDLGMALLGAHIVMAVAGVGIEALYQRGWWVIVGCMAIPFGADTLRPRSGRVAP